MSPEIEGRLEDIIDRFYANQSVGLAQTGPESILEPEELLKLADRRMYAAKAKSRITPGTHIVSDDDESVAVAGD